MHRCFSVRLRQYRCELFAAVAGNPVVGTQTREESSADLDEDLVANSMSMRIINELEMVDVDEDQRQRSAMAPGMRRSRRQLIVEVAPIERADERVRHGEHADALIRGAQRSLQQYDTASRRQACNKLLFARHFGHVVVSPRLQPGYGICGRIESGKHQHVNVRWEPRRAYGATQVQAV